MSGRAPEAIHHLWTDISKQIPHAILSGIVGDTRHSFGYHLARRDLPGSDYSVQRHLDRLGADDCASALDISLPPDLMRTCTRRLLAAAEKKDPRLKALREFCGTLDGTVTYPWDLATNTSEGPGTWDDSHLWHIHMSFYRAYADDYAALAPIADVLAGVPAQPKPKPPTVNPTEATMPIIVRVSRKDAAKQKVRWPGDFEFRGDGTLVHIPTVDRLQALGAIGCPVKTVTIAQYRALGGK